MEEQVTCWVCFEVMEDPTTLGCSHSFCKVRRATLFLLLSLVLTFSPLLCSNLDRTVSLKCINATQIARSAEGRSVCRFQNRTLISSPLLSVSRVLKPRLHLLMLALRLNKKYVFGLPTLCGSFKGEPLWFLTSTFSLLFWTSQWK